MVLADGSSRPIEDVQPGGRVLSTDPATGKTSPPQPVMATIRDDAGEEVRSMRRGGGWDIRGRNAHGNYLDACGNVADPADPHGVEVHSR